MDRAKLNERAKSLNGMSYTEWRQLSTIVDGVFRAKEDELKQTLQLEEDMDYKEFIRSLFG